MTFFAPAMLWSLLALVPLVAVYFLKVRPRRKPTTAYFLWQKIFQSQRSSNLFQRFRDVWSLVLMALAVTAVCIALARPEWTDQRQDLLIVIDHSASMGAKDGRTTRLELAKKMAADVVAGMGGNQRTAIATLGRHLTYLSHLTDNPRELLDAIERVELAASTLNWQALDELRLMTQKQSDESLSPDRRVLLVSDGSFGDRQIDDHIELLKVGTPRENVGIVAADMAYLPGTENQLAFYYQVASSFSAEQNIDLTVTCLDDESGERLFKVIPLTVAPGIAKPEVFTLDGAPPGRWLAEIEVDDALASDNRAHLVAIKPPPVRVVVDATDPYFFQNSVLAFAEGQDQLALVDTQADGSDFDVVLAKGNSPDAPHAIILQPSGEGPWWSSLGDEIKVGAARVIVDDHPALRHLEPAAITFEGARQITPLEGAQVLVADDRDVPLVYLARHEGRSAVVVNIDPLAADFYFSAWFPVLVHSAATYLAGREMPLAASYRPGDAVPIPGARDETVSTINAEISNDRRQPTVGLHAPNADGPSSPNHQPPDQREAVAVRGKWWNGAEQLGFIEIKNDAGTWPVGISLLAAEETMIDNATAKSTDEPLNRGQSPGYLLTVLAIVALTAESLLYHRRKVG